MYKNVPSWEFHPSHWTQNGQLSWLSYSNEASSPLIDAAAAVTLLGNMHGGYNVATLVNLLDDDALAEAAAEELKSTILVFDAFHDVAAKKRIPMIFHRPKTRGLARTSLCTLVPCTKWRGTA